MNIKKKKILKDFKSVSPQIIQILEENSLTSLQLLATVESNDLAELLNIPEIKAVKIIEEAKSNIVFEFESLKQVLARRSKILKLSTGSKNVDNLIEGGIETQSIFEIYGEFASGKTHFMHQLAVMTMKPVSEGGLNGSVLYIDTEQTFRESKILHIAKARNVSEDVVINNLIHIRAKNSEQQLLIIEKVVNEPKDIFVNLETHPKPIKVVIIDSMISKLRSEFMGRGQLSERQQKLNHMLNLCLTFAINNNGLVLITNQVTSDPAAMFFGPSVKAAGGHVMSHAATYRLYIRKGKDRKRIVKVVDAPNSPTNETAVYLTSLGIVDSDEDTIADDAILTNTNIDNNV
jgi:DNA repair protein RadA